MNNLEKKPIKGGTPAIENRHTVTIRSNCESKPKEDIRKSVLFFGKIVEESDIRRAIRLILYKNM